MVEDYADSTEETEFAALEAFWVQNFGVVSPKDQGTVSAEFLARGREIHDMSCAHCHSRSKSAFISYKVSQATKSIALTMDTAGIKRGLWYVHFLACFVGLAYVPFSKMFHVFSTPLSLLAISVLENGKEDVVNVATRQMIELAGCSHGGACHWECPVWLKRKKRINMTSQFSPTLEFVMKKQGKDLGTRKYED